MPADRVRAYLDEQGVPYEVAEHPRAVTAQEVAAAEHVSGWTVAKPVMLWADGELVMAVLPAPMQVDLDRAPGALGAEHVRLAAESDFASRFPDCEEGAEPPFGQLYDVPVVADHSLFETDELHLRAGTHTESLRMKTDDWRRLVDPREVDLAQPAD